MTEKEISYSDFIRFFYSKKLIVLSTIIITLLCAFLYDIYENIARFSYHYKFPIEIGIDRDEYNMNQALSRYLEEYNLVKHRKLKEDIPVKYNYLHIFDKCLFPIGHLTKKQLKLLVLLKLVNLFIDLQLIFLINIQFILINSNLFLKIN